MKRQMKWVIGILFSLIGDIVTRFFLKGLRYKLGTLPKPRISAGGKEVPPWLTGALERLFFTVLIGFEIPGVVTAMVGWLALKLATNWNHPDWKDKSDARTFAFSALLGGLVSMFFALLGGLICAGK